MLIGAAFLICLATVPAAGGRLGLLGRVPLKGGAVVLLALALQIGIVSAFPGEGSHGVHSAVHLASYVLVAVFLVLNRDFPYLWLIASGGALNFLAIAANGGVMPADPDALAAAGIAPEPTGFANSRAVEDPRLPFLGDVFWVPPSWPVSNVFSVGDVLIVVGAFLALHTVCRSRLAAPRFAWPSRRPRAGGPS